MEQDIKKLIDSFTAKITNPRDECFDASVSLGVLLAVKSFPVKLIRGKYNGVKHWWLQHHDTIIDPTLHQFEKTNNESGYVQEGHLPMNFDSMAGYLFEDH